MSELKFTNDAIAKRARNSVCASAHAGISRSFEFEKFGFKKRVHHRLTQTRHHLKRGFDLDTIVACLLLASESTPPRPKRVVCH